MKRDSWKFLGGDMGKGALMKYMLLFLALALLLFTGWEGYFYIKDNFTSSAARQVMKPQGVNSATHVSDNEDRVVSRVHYKRPDFEAGISFPRGAPHGRWNKMEPPIPASPHHSRPPPASYQPLSFSHTT